MAKASSLALQLKTMRQVNVQGNDQSVLLISFLCWSPLAHGKTTCLIREEDQGGKRKMRCMRKRLELPENWENRKITGLQRLREG